MKNYIIILLLGGFHLKLQFKLLLWELQWLLELSHWKKKKTDLVLNDTGEHLFGVLLL